MVLEKNTNRNKKLKNPKLAAAKKKVSAVSQRPKRVTRPNRLFLDSSMWDNANSSASSEMSLPLTSPAPTLRGKLQNYIMFL